MGQRPAGARREREAGYFGPNGGDRRVEFRRREGRADRALGRPMGARADRLDPLARMRMSDKAVRLEPERMQGVPEPAIDELQKRELRRSQDAAPEARRVQDRHEARRGKMMRVHDLDRPDGCLGLRQNPIGDGERLRIEGERFLGAVAAVGLVDGQALRQETEKARRLIPPLGAMQGEDRQHAAHRRRGRPAPFPFRAQLADELASRARLVETAVPLRVSGDPFGNMQRRISRARIARPDARERQVPTDKRRRAARGLRLFGHELVEVKGPREPGVSGPKET